MMRDYALHGCLVCAATIGLGCATVDPRPDYRQASDYAQRATGQSAAYTPDDEAAHAAAVESMLADGLTVDEAVAVAMLNNPRLQAAFMQLGMARADVVQSGLLSNPTLGVSLRLPSGGGLANLEAGLAQNLADLWQIPTQTRAAEHALQQTILDVARQAAELAFDTEMAYYQAVGADQLHAISSENLSNARELLELAQTRQKLGAAGEVDVNLTRGLVVEAELAVEITRLKAANARRVLSSRLALINAADDLTLIDPLPDLSDVEFDAESLVTLARQERLDLRAAGEAVATAQARRDAEWRNVFPSVAVGVAFERGERGRSGGPNPLADAAAASLASGMPTAPDLSSNRGGDPQVIVGPSVDLELPVFDQNSAQIAKATFALRQAQKALDGVDRAMVQAVRSAADEVRTARRMIGMFNEQFLPLAESNLKLSRRSYEAGRSPFLAVLEAQRFYLDSRRRYVEARQAAATTLPELERAVGIPIETISTLLASTDASEHPPRVTSRDEDVAGGP